MAKSRTKKTFKYLGIALGTVFAIVVILFLVALGRALMLQEDSIVSSQKWDSGIEPQLSDAKFQHFVNLFCGALKFKTVSTAPGEYDGEELLKLVQFLKEGFPKIFNSNFVVAEIINTYSLLLTVKGSDSTLMPYMMASHMDVVPVDPDQWSLDPFLGDVVNHPETGEKVIWGRGAIDDKSLVMGILSALEHLIESGWTPTRSFYIGFGHDEEVYGFHGAAHIAEVLKERNVSLDFLLDEGLPITQGIIQGIEVPVAAIGVSEKGRMNVRVSVEGIGGHSSIPPHDQATGILAEALQKIYQNPQPSMFGRGPEEDMLNFLAPKASWPFKLFFANTWLFGPLLSIAMGQKREGNALMRTTTAITMIRAGVKDNIVPSRAWALINHRVHPAQSLEEVLQHDIDVINDERVKVERLDSAEPHPVSPYGPESQPYTLIAEAVKLTYPEAITVPGLMIANTDTIHYRNRNLTDKIYRVYPLILRPAEIATIHGADEHLSVNSFENVIAFFCRIIRLADTMLLMK